VVRDEGMSRMGKSGREHKQRRRDRLLNRNVISSRSEPSISACTSEALAVVAPMPNVQA
jgi:hypothetical protein